MIRLLVALLLAWSTAAWAAFPERPVRLVVGFAPGGSDIGGRIVAQKLSELWGQPVVVENKAGAAGNIGADAVAKAAPDGYTMLLFVNSYTINTTVHKNLSWDLLRDFAPVISAACRSSRPGTRMCRFESGAVDGHLVLALRD